jgi:aspartate aminotransferase
MTARPRLARRLDAVLPSATVAVSQRAKELQSQGIDVLSFSVGEPDFETPEHIREAARRAVDRGSSHYTHVRGVVELRDAICADSKRRRGGQTHKASEVVVSVGAKHTLFNLALALYEEGDEVIIPAPYWVSYPDQVRLAGATPVIAETTEKDGFRLTPDGLRAAVTGKTKAIILCSPSNPTGAAYDAAQLRALADVMGEGSYWIVVDEIYGELVYGGFDQRSLLSVAPELKPRLLIVDGMSKTYAMTGWRIGWFLGPEEVAKACETVQSQATTNPTAVAQHAALAGLTGPREPLEAMRKQFERRRALVVDGLNRIDGFRCRAPEGAFYAFPNVEALIGRKTGGAALPDDLAITKYLLEAARVAVVPGSAFGAPGYLRVSYATSEAQLEEGLRRIREAVGKLT